MTDKRQKATKNVNAMHINKTVNFVEYNYSSPEEAFEFFWSLIADEHNNFNKIDQEKHTIEQIFFMSLEPHDQQIYYVNIRAIYTRKNKTQTFRINGTFRLK